MLKAILLLLLSCSIANADIIVTEHCHKEQSITKDKNGDYQVSKTGETICESTPNDWREQ